MDEDSLFTPGVLGLVGLARFGLGREGHLDRLLGPALLLFGQVDQGALVGLGERGLEQAAWPQTAGPHDVDLGGVQGELCPQVQPGQQTEDDREEAVHLTGMLEVVADQIPAHG
jgi:hypothetical protein